LDEVKNDIKFILVERIEEALNAAIKPSEKTDRVKQGWTGSMTGIPLRL
jgi:hypothetical protein